MKKWILVFLLAGCLFSAHAQSRYATINHIGIEVRSVDRSAAFYQSLFHLDSIPNPWPKGTAKWFKIGDHQQLHIILADSNEKIIAPENFHFAFSVHSMDEFISRLNQRHIPYENSDDKPSSVSLRPDGVHQIYIKDPDGYTVEINDQVY